ncbi:SMP-30/gluconolactonase/LRE family protein [Variovorax sp. LjRoot84]|uniref:SMP-30/gluconolactonase/LRE family protein n=1 Tax=Variovorax sp. LjRoot84 TaxID=3342340 RepID=UPI003ECD5F11
MEDPCTHPIKLDFHGEHLSRPESVLVTGNGRVFVSDHEVGVLELGCPRRPLVGPPKDFVPNGFALLESGEFLIANLGGEGGVWKLDASRSPSPFLMEVERQSMRNTNFVMLDHKGRLWITVCTRQTPRELAFDRRIADGYIAVVDAQGARVVADGLAFANECRMHPGGEWLYVNESVGRRLVRFRIHEESGRVALGAKECVHEFGDGDFPDGLAFDCLGGAWVACVISNRVIRISPSGEKQVVLDDSDYELNALAEASFAKLGIEKSVFEMGMRRGLGNVSSVAFGGADLRTVYLGSLGGDRLASFRSEVAGHQLAHWQFGS